MDAELEKLAKWVWARRTTLMAAAPRVGANTAVKPHMLNHEINPAVREIYGQYCKSAIKAAKPEHKKRNYYVDRAERYKRLLLQIKDALPGAQLEIQGNDLVKSKNADHWAVALMSFDDITGTFFHFKKARGTCSHRVYINVKEAARLRAFGSIARRVWSIDGLMNCKVLGPCAARSDTIVLYFRGMDALRRGLDAISEWVQTHSAYFDVEVPKLTQRVPGLQGVSTGMEPPKLQLIEFQDNDNKTAFSSRNVNQSFGTYRAQLLYMALEKTAPKKSGWLRPASHYRDYLKQVTRYFMAAGIDVNKPWAQDGALLNKVPVPYRDAPQLETAIRKQEERMLQT